MTVAVTRAREAGLELARMLATLLWVGATSALLIGGVGALPGWIAGETAVRHVGTIADAERRLGARLVLPGYFPERLAWPPAEVRIAGGRRGSVALTFLDHSGGPALQIVQATAEGAAIAPELLASRTVLAAQPTAVGSRPGTLSTVLLDGQRWQELSWDLRGRPVMVRTRGDVEELYRMARTTHREGGR